MRIQKPSDTISTTITPNNRVNQRRMYMQHQYGKEVEAAGENAKQTNEYHPKREYTPKGQIESVDLSTNSSLFPGLLTNSRHDIDFPMQNNGDSLQPQLSLPSAFSNDMDVSKSTKPSKEINNGKDRDVVNLRHQLLLEILSQQDSRKTNADVANRKLNDDNGVAFDWEKLPRIGSVHSVHGIMGTVANARNPSSSQNTNEDNSMFQQPLSKLKMSELASLILKGRLDSFLEASSSSPSEAVDKPVINNSSVSLLIQGQVTSDKRPTNHTQSFAQKEVISSESLTTVPQSPVQTSFENPPQNNPLNDRQLEDLANRIIDSFNERHKPLHVAQGIQTTQENSNLTANSSLNKSTCVRDNPQCFKRNPTNFTQGYVRVPRRDHVSTVSQSQITRGSHGYVGPRSQVQLSGYPRNGNVRTTRTLNPVTTTRQSLSRVSQDNQTIDHRDQNRYILQKPLRDANLRYFLNHLEESNRSERATRNTSSFQQGARNTNNSSYRYLPSYSESMALRTARVHPLVSTTNTTSTTTNVIAITGTPHVSPLRRTNTEQVVNLMGHKPKDCMPVGFLPLKKSTVIKNTPETGGSRKASDGTTNLESRPKGTSDYDPDDDDIMITKVTTKDAERGPIERIDVDEWAENVTNCSPKPINIKQEYIREESCRNSKKEENNPVACADRNEDGGVINVNSDDTEVELSQINEIQLRIVSDVAYTTPLLENPTGKSMQAEETPTVNELSVQKCSENSSENSTENMDVGNNTSINQNLIREHIDEGCGTTDMCHTSTEDCIKGNDPTIAKERNLSVDIDLASVGVSSQEQTTPTLKSEQEVQEALPSKENEIVQSTLSLSHTVNNGEEGEENPSSPVEIDNELSDSFSFTNPRLYHKMDVKDRLKLLKLETALKKNQRRLETQTMTWIRKNSLKARRKINQRIEDIRSKYRKTDITQESQMNSSSFDQVVNTATTTASVKSATDGKSPNEHVCVTTQVPSPIAEEAEKAQIETTARGPTTKEIEKTHNAIEIQTATVEVVAQVQVPTQFSLTAKEIEKVHVLTQGQSLTTKEIEKALITTDDQSSTSKEIEKVQVATQVLTPAEEEFEKTLITIEEQSSTSKEIEKVQGTTQVLTPVEKEFEKALTTQEQSSTSKETKKAQVGVHLQSPTTKEFEKTLITTEERSSTSKEIEKVQVTTQVLTPAEEEFEKTLMTIEEQSSTSKETENVQVTTQVLTPVEKEFEKTLITTEEQSSTSKEIEKVQVTTQVLTPAKEEFEKTFTSIQNQTSTLKETEKAQASPEVQSPITKVQITSQPRTTIAKEAEIPQTVKQGNISTAKKVETIWRRSQMKAVDKAWRPAPMKNPKTAKEVEMVLSTTQVNIPTAKEAEKLSTTTSNKKRLSVESNSAFSNDKKYLKVKKLQSVGEMTDAQEQLDFCDRQSKQNHQHHRPHHSHHHSHHRIHHCSHHQQQLYKKMKQPKYSTNGWDKPNATTELNQGIISTLNAREFRNVLAEDQFVAARNVIKTKHNIPCSQKTSINTQNQQTLQNIFGKTSQVESVPSPVNKNKHRFPSIIQAIKGKNNRFEHKDHDVKKNRRQETTQEDRDIEKRENTIRSEKIFERSEKHVLHCKRKNSPDYEEHDMKKKEKLETPREHEVKKNTNTDSPKKAEPSCNVRENASNIWERLKSKYSNF